MVLSNIRMQSTAVTWSTSSQTAQGLLLADPSLSNSPEFLSYVNSAIAYVNITDLLGDSATEFQQQQSSALQTSLSSLVTSSSSTVQAGYQAIYNTISNTFLSSSIGQVEILFSPIFNGSITIQAALQHPLSQGRIYITSADPFAMPAIDPAYLSHAADIVILREGLKLARKIAQTAPLSQFIGEELSPGSAVQSDADWENYAANSIGTEYHPSSSCAMMPLEKGGVVDPELRVYGLANVRVADASVFPTDFSAHVSTILPLGSASRVVTDVFLFTAACARVRPRRAGVRDDPRDVHDHHDFRLERLARRDDGDELDWH